MTFQHAQPWTGIDKYVKPILVFTVDDGRMKTHDLEKSLRLSYTISCLCLRCNKCLFSLWLECWQFRTISLPGMRCAAVGRLVYDRVDRKVEEWWWWMVTGGRSLFDRQRHAVARLSVGYRWFVGGVAVFLVVDVIVTVPGVGGVRWIGISYRVQASTTYLQKSEWKTFCPGLQPHVGQFPMIFVVFNLFLMREFASYSTCRLLKLSGHAQSLSPS